MKYLFTVFTPTFNRAHTIYRVYESLKNQTFRDFEWLVVDDGSTDNTKVLIEQWQRESDFPIRYVWQTNQHKKVAFNHGVRVAEGELFLPADADDSFPNHTLERFAHHWAAIPDEQKPNFSGVCGLCQHENGRIVGNPFPGDWGIDSNSLEIRYRFGVEGEKWGFTRTDILREFPFPEDVPGHIPESLIWVPIGCQYQTRFINEVVRTYFLDAGNQITGKGNPAKSAPGILLWKQSVLDNELVWLKYKPVYFLLEAARWTRFRLHVSNLGVATRNWLPNRYYGRALIILTAPLGLTWWFVDKLRYRG